MFLLALSCLAQRCPDCEEESKKFKGLPGEIPVKEGMTKRAVLTAAGRPYYFVGQNDPLYLERAEYQQDEYGYVLDVWYYAYPKKYTVYFKDGLVAEVVYEGASGEFVEQEKEILKKDIQRP